jgi:hypothetical protein
MTAALFATTAGSDSAIGVATITASNHTLTFAVAHGLTDGQVVMTASPSGGAIGVLVTGAPYYVANSTATTMQLRYAPGSPVMQFATDGTASIDKAESTYDAKGMRQALGGLLYKARRSGPDLGRYGARAGLIANGAATSPVSLAGFTVSVDYLNAVIVPNPNGANGGPYICAIDSTQLTLNAADSNPRIDLLVARVRDTQEDSSGFVTADLYLITGTPAPVPSAPAVPSGELLVATFTVPASGAGSPTVALAEQIWTVAAGGILPTGSPAEYPATNRARGTYIDDDSTQTLLRYSGSGYEAIASARGYQYWQTITYTANGTFNKADYPGLRAVMVRCQGGGGAGGGAAITGTGSAASGGGGQGGNYVEKWVLASALATSETVTRGSAGTGVAGATGNNGGTSSFGSLCIAGGGAGGQSNSSTATWSTAISATPNTTATGDRIRYGSAGGFGLINGASDFALSGEGGDSVWGIGARPVQPGAGSVGFNASGYGGGGSGGANSNSQAAAVAGGNGTAGIIYVDLYI